MTRRAVIVASVSTVLYCACGLGLGLLHGALPASADLGTSFLFSIGVLMPVAMGLVSAIHRRVVGVLVGVSLAAVAWLAGYGLSFGGDPRWRVAVWLAGLFVCMAWVWWLTVSLLVVHILWRPGRRAADKWPPRCRVCGYLLVGLPEPRCPECGTPAPECAPVDGVGADLGGRPREGPA